MSKIGGTYEHSDNVLCPLIGLLNDFWKPGAPNPIPEILYLHQMSETGKLPGETFYPYAIITYMRNRHNTFLEDVRQNPRLAMSFRCQYLKKFRWHMYEFSNTMPLYADIISLHYLHVYRWIYGDFPPRLYNLKMLMTSKYTIYEDIYCSSCKINEICEIVCENRNCFVNNPRKVTFGRIVRSYLSIMLWMYNYFPTFSASVHTIFPYSTLPGMIYSCYFPVILPRGIGLDYRYLLAVNLAISAVCETIFPTLSIYHRIVRWCTVLYDVYTEDMRIDICIKLGILMKQNGPYYLSPIFEQHRLYYEMILETIRKIRWNDLTVDETLDQMDHLNTKNIVAVSSAAK